MNPAQPARLRFGPYRLDPSRRAVYRDGARLHLTPKPFDTLAYLVDHRDRTVSKHELLERVWAGTSVTEGVLTQAIREVRRTLGDDVNDPSFVLTVPREGYRFVALVQPDAEPSAPPGGDEPDRVAAPPDTPARAASAAPWRTHAAALSAVAGAAIMALLAVDTARWDQPSPAPRAHRLERLSPLTAAELSAVKPVFSPDGSAIAYVSDTEEPGVLDVFVTDAVEYRPRRLTRAVHASGDLPVFTADGTGIVFSRFRSGELGSRLPDLWRVPVAGGDPVLFLAGATGAGFSPDGRTVAYTRVTQEGPALYMGPVDDPGRHREIARPGFTPRWSRDGRSIAFTSSNPEGGAGEVWLVSPDGSTRRRLTSRPAQIYGLDWIDRRRLVYSANEGGTYQLWEVGLDGAAPSAVTSGVGDYVGPTFAPERSRIGFAYLRPASDLHVADLDGATGHRVLARSDYRESPRLSPDARRVATVLRGADAEPRAYAIDLATGVATPLGDRAARTLCWVDADRVALATPTPDAAATDVLMVGADHTESSLLVRLTGQVTGISVASDLRRMAYVEAVDGGSRIVVRDLAEGTVAVLARGYGLRAPRLAPDGYSVAWSGPSQGGSIAINGLWVGRAGGAVRRVRTDGYGPVWSADGRALFFSRYTSANGGAGVWRVDLATDAATQVIEAERVGDFDVVGSRLVYAIASGRSQIFTADVR
jgi:Tol biopolymer transport system component/DNA-binding winged helix-turn-helix (wHTH) protein